jgi:pimeloyl-ACP methyl ester carboxylesterase
MHELFEELDLEDVTLVAWSRSASIGLAYWELFGSSRLGRFVFIGITPCMSRREDWEWGYSTDPIEFRSQILSDHEGVVRGVVDALFAVSPPADEIEEMVRTTMLSPPSAGAGMLDDHGAIDWRDMLETISVPTLVCVGRHDRNAPVPAAEFVHHAVPNSELVIFEDSAHVPFYEKPDEFNERLVAFIDASRTLSGPLEQTMRCCGR